MTQKNEMQETARIDALFEKVSALIEQGRQRVVSAVNIAEVYTKYCIGQYIVEDEQQGKDRAEYGKQVLKELSARLTERFGDGWSYPSMKNIRQFYLIYSKRLDTVYPIDTPKAKHCLANSEPRFTLSWSSYLVLMRIDNPDERSFYEIECAKQQWSVRQLQRQVASLRIIGAHPC